MRRRVITAIVLAALSVVACRHDWLFNPLDAYDVSPTEFVEIVSGADSGLDWLDADGSNRWFCVVTKGGVELRFNVLRSDYAVAARLNIIKEKYEPIWKLLRLCGALWLVDKMKGQFVGDYMK